MRSTSVMFSLTLVPFLSTSTDTVSPGLVKQFSCDWYDYEKGLPEAMNAYKGEFMAQYEWAFFR